MGRLDPPKSCNYYWQIMLIMMSDPLVCVQLDASKAFCSVARQPQFNVLAGEASLPYAMEGYRLVTNSLDRAL